MNYTCPHCKRTLRIPERYLGMAGACNFCGGRIVVDEQLNPAVGDAPKPSGQPSGSVVDSDITAPRDSGLVRAQEEALESLRTTVTFLESQLAEAQTNLERVSKELVAETSAKVDAQIAKDMAELRVHRLEEKLTEKNESNDDTLLLKTNLNRMEAQLEHSRQEAGELAKDLEAERSSRLKAEASVKALEERIRILRTEVLDRIADTAHTTNFDLDDADHMLDLAMPVTEDLSESGELEFPVPQDFLPDAPTDVVVPKRIVIGFAAMALVIVASLLVMYVTFYGGVWQISPARTATAASEQPAPSEPAAPTIAPEPSAPSPELVAPPSPEPTAPEASAAPAPAKPEPAPVPPEPEPTGPGTLAVKAEYSSASGTIPAAGASIVVIPVRLDAESSKAFFTTVGINPAIHDLFAQWLYIGRPDQAKVEQFAEPCQLLAAHATKVGREEFSKQLAALIRIEPPEKWIETKVADTGEALLDPIESGRYMVLPRPDGDKSAWPVPEPVALDDARVAVVRKGERAELAIALVDKASAIRGVALDAETKAPMPGVPLIVSGAAAGGEPGINVVTGDDGTFAVDPAAAGYGEFVIRCDSVPEGYKSATKYTGIRAMSKITEPVEILVGKKAFDKLFVSGRVSLANGQPVDKCRVFRISRDGAEQEMAVTDATGLFRIELPNWTLRLFAASPGTVRSEVQEFKIAAGEHVWREFVMPPAGRIVMRAHTPDGAVPEAASLGSLTCDGNDKSTEGLLARDGEAFVVPYLAAGSYELTLKVDGFKDAKTSAIIDNFGADVTMDVNLEPAG